MDLAHHQSPPPNSPHAGASFPIIAVAIIGILATAFLLVSYYVFVIKCCLSWHRIDLLARLSLSRRRRHPNSPPSAHSPLPETRGLTDAAIRSIPISLFKKSLDGANECAVCLNEFRDEEKLRAIPNCGHLFHIDCIDVWLQNSANCPLCRTSISPDSEHILVPILAEDPSNPRTDGNDNDNDDDDAGFVVIEIGSSCPNQTPSHEAITITPSPRKTGPKNLRNKGKKLGHVTSMGDECIDINRQKDEQFAVQQPIRRSFSMDSAADTQLYFAVQEIIQTHRQMNLNETSCPGEGCSSSRGKKSIFFSFGQGRASRSAVQPVSS